MEINTETLQNMVKWNGLNSLYARLQEKIELDTPVEESLACYIANQMLKAYRAGVMDTLRPQSACDDDILCGNGQYGGHL